MEKIKITFLGTSSATPTITRNHTAILLRYKSENMLIDCGEGTQRQFRKAKINPCKLTKLLLTHFHGDHVFGLPGLFQTLALNNYQKTLEIYGPRGTKKFINNIFKVFILAKKIKTKVLEINKKFLKTQDFTLTALPLSHDSPTLGYTFQEKDKLKIHKSKLNKILKKLKPQKKELSKLSLLTKGKNTKINKKTLKAKDFTYLQKGRKVSIILDTKLCKNAKKLAKDSDLAIIESTFLEASEKTKNYYKKHLTAKEAATIAKQSKVKKLILTHLSQRYEYKDSLILKEAKKHFKNTKIAKDFMTLEI